ncbi:MAG: hypothetical protein PHD68_02730 [Rugosibacter sp.]|nr:hypothetical protein [Rugosibacter sp.]
MIRFKIKVGVGEAPALQGGRAKNALLAVADGKAADSAKRGMAITPAPAAQA